MAAIEIYDSSDMVISGGRIDGADVGIKIRNSTVEAQDNYFHNVGKSFDVDGSSRVRITGNRSTGSARQSDKARTHVGWRRPSGPPLPAFCPDCKSVFASKQYNMGSSLIYSRDNKEVCPRCKSPDAMLSEGLFDLSKNIIKIIESSSETRKKFVEASIDFLYSGGIDDNKLIAAIPEKSRELSSLSKKMGGAALACLAMIGLMAAIINDGFGAYEHLDKRGYIPQISQLVDSAPSTKDNIEQILSASSKVVYVLRNESIENSNSR